MRLFTFGNNTSNNTIMSQILLVGPRASGKLTYLSGLAGWESQQKYNSKIRIKAVGEETELLRDFWKEIVCQKCCLPPTNFNRNRYQFSLNFSIPHFFKDELQHTNLYITNVAGEVFEMPNSEGWKIYEEYGGISRDLIHIMVMIDCSMHRFDEKYANSINQLIKYCSAQNLSMSMCKIALVISQCDAVDVWVNRKNTTKVMSRFRQVLDVMNNHSMEQKFAWKPFVVSTFGGIGRDYLEPNSVYEDSYKLKGFKNPEVLRNPSAWKPYGLFSPLYWLCTGKDLNGLDYY